MEDIFTCHSDVYFHRNLVATDAPAGVEAAVGRSQSGQVKKHCVVPSGQREPGVAGALVVPVSDQAVFLSHPHLTGHQPDVLPHHVNANGYEVPPAAYHPLLGHNRGSGVLPTCPSRLGAQTQLEEDEPEFRETHEGVRSRSFTAQSPAKRYARARLEQI